MEINFSLILEKDEKNMLFYFLSDTYHTLLWELKKKFNLKSEALHWTTCECVAGRKGWRNRKKEFQPTDRSEPSGLAPQIV